MKIPLTENLRPTRVINVVMYWSGDTLILRQRDNQGYSSLNITAAFVWQLCDGKRSLLDISHLLGEEYKQDIHITIDDVSEIVKKLYNKNLVSLTSADLRPVIRLNYTGFPHAFDKHNNFFLNLLTDWVDIIIVNDGEQADIVITLEGNNNDDIKLPIAPVNFLINVVDCIDVSNYDVVFITDGISTNGTPPTVNLPHSYMNDLSASIDPVGKKILQELLSNDEQPEEISQIEQKPTHKKLTIGMATYDDYDGVYFSVQAIRMFHPEVTDETEILVIDNNPGGPCSKDLKNLGAWIKGYRYIPNNKINGTAVRDFVFHEAQTNYVMCIDSHVFIEPGAIRKLIDYFDTNPETSDLLQGPLVYDNLTEITTHFEPVWREGMFGVWGTDSRGTDPDAVPFAIPMQGLGLAACRRDAWQGYNPRFSGFGGEEGYIHQKFRNAGARTLCLPFLRWLHRFARPMGTQYKNVWEDRIRNYLIGFEEVGLDTDEVLEHFRSHLSPDIVKNVVDTLDLETRPIAEKD